MVRWLGDPRAPKCIHSSRFSSGLVLPERSTQSDLHKVSCLSRSPIPIHLALVGPAGGVEGGVDQFCLLGIRWGVGFVNLKEFVFLLLLLIVFE